MGYDIILVGQMLCTTNKIEKKCRIRVHYRIREKIESGPRGKYFNPLEKCVLL